MRIAQIQDGGPLFARSLPSFHRHHHCV